MPSLRACAHPSFSAAASEPNGWFQAATSAMHDFFQKISAWGVEKDSSVFTKGKNKDQAALTHVA